MDTRRPRRVRWENSRPQADDKLKPTTNRPDEVVGSPKYKEIMPLHGQLAHLSPFEKQPVVFLTVCTAQRAPLLANESAHSVLRSLWTESHSRQGWAVGDYVIMPDHLHLFARQANDACSLSKWMQTWKSLSSRTLATRLNIVPPLWQKDYFDRFLRSEESYSEKWNYVRMNPVRAKLAPTPEDWPYHGKIHDLQF